MAWKQETPGKNHWRRRRSIPMLQAEQICCRISSSSRFEKPSTSSFPFLIWTISLITLVFHLSSSMMGWYLISKISVDLRCSTWSFCVWSRIFLRLLPVVDLTSLLMMFNICFGSCFWDLRICSTKFRNLFMRIILTCLVSVIGSIRQRWVS